VELVVAIGKDGAGIAREAALGHVYGYAVGLDLTRRDLQLAAREKGRPWDTGKGFDRAAPVSPIQPASRLGHPGAGAIWLDVNGERRQQGDLSQLIWPVPDVIAFLSQLFELRAGDLIFTGTPAGVGPVKRGDHLSGAVDGVDRIELRIAP
jgi:fumarylpyruvate hydrolase